MSEDERRGNEVKEDEKGYEVARGGGLFMQVPTGSVSPSGCLGEYTESHDLGVRRSWLRTRRAQSGSGHHVPRPKQDILLDDPYHLTTILPSCASSVHQLSKMR